MNRTYRTLRPLRARASTLLRFGLAAFVAAAVPLPTQADAVVREVVASAEPCLDLQPKPDSTSRPLRCLAPGERMNLLQSQDGWALVRLTDGLRGWVEFALIRPIEEARLTRVSTGQETSTPASRRIAELEAELASVEAERLELQRGTSALRGEIYEIRLANDRLLASAAARAQEQSNAERRIADLEAELATAKTQRELTAAEALERETRIAALEAEVNDATQSERQVMERLADAERLLAAAEAERLDVVSQFEALKLENEALQERLAEERRRADLQEAAVHRSESLQEALASVEAARALLEQENASLRNEAEGLRAKAARLAELAAETPTEEPDEHREALQRLATLEQALAATEGDRLALEQSNSELRAEIDALRSENERLASSPAAPLTAAAGEGAPAGLDLFEKALGLTEAERLALEESLAEAESEVLAEKNKVEDLNARLAAAEVFLTASEDQRVANAEQVEALREELERLKASAAMPRVDLEGSAPGEFSAASTDDAESDVTANGDGEKTSVEVPANPSTPPDEDPVSAVSTVEPANPSLATGEWTAVVEAWAKAWSEQRVEDYLYFYSPSFEPPNGASRSEWEALRRERITGPESIDVRVALADLRPQGDDRVEVVFLQSYESDRLTDVVLKTLELVLEDGVWKIAAERVE